MPRFDQLLRTGRRELQLLALLTLAITAAFFAASNLSDVIIYNASASMPQGFYTRTRSSVARGSIVTVRARDVAASYASERRFIDANDRFLKRVAAHGGDLVCARDDFVSVNHTIIARRRTLDHRGRPLPTWSGCRRLEGEVLLIGDGLDSFDGRYWGPTGLQQVEGVWRRLY